MEGEEVEVKQNLPDPLVEVEVGEALTLAPGRTLGAAVREEVEAALRAVEDVEVTRVGGVWTLGEVGSRVGAVGRAKVAVGVPERTGEVARTGLRGQPGRLGRAGEGVQGGLLAVEIQSALGTGATM